MTAASIEEGGRRGAIFGYCLQDTLARWDTLSLWLIGAGVKQTDERAWFPLPVPVDRQHRSWLKAPCRAVQTLVQVLHWYTARGQWTAPAIPAVR